MNCFGSRVMKVAKAGGTPVTLAPGIGALTIATDGANVYWSDTSLIENGPTSGCAVGQPCPSSTSGPDVAKVPVGGGSLTILAPKDSAPLGLAVRSGTVYWTSATCSNASPPSCSGTLMTSTAGGPPTALVTAPGHTFGTLAVDATGANYIDGAAVMRVALAGGPPTMLAPGPAVSVATDGTSVYFATNSCLPPKGFPETCESALMKVSVSGGSVVTLATIPPGSATPSVDVPDGLAVDAQNLYWTGFGCGDAGCAGASVNRMPKGGGPITTLASNPISAGTGAGLAVDDTSVYWLDFACPTGQSMLCVMKLPK
jgi:hypothetical protein